MIGRPVREPLTAFDVVMPAPSVALIVAGFAAGFAPDDLRVSRFGASRRCGHNLCLSQLQIAATPRHQGIYLSKRPGFPVGESLWFFVVNHSEHGLTNRR